MDRKSWLLFATVSLLWGVPYFLIKVSLHDVGPFAIVWVRIAIGALVLLPYVLATGALRSLGARIWWLVVLAIVEIVVPFTLITAGERYISSSLTGILMAVEPLSIAVLAFPFDPSERLGKFQFIGLLVGLAGVGVLLDGGLTGTQELVGAGMVLVATIFYGAGALIIKLRFSDVPPAGTVCVALTIAAVLLFVPATLDLPRALPSISSVLSLFVLGTACTGAGFLAFFALIGRAGAGRAAVITYVTPVVALVLGIAIRHEGVTLLTLAGLALILFGSRLATSGPAAVTSDEMRVA